VVVAVVRPLPAARFISLIWQVRAGSLPLAVRDCARCHRRSRFESSGLFRVNASGRRLDVWLVYRCERCQLTWNRTVEERRSVAELADRLDRYHTNDAALAAQIAGDVSGLARAGVAVEIADARLVSSPLPAPASLADGTGLEIIFQVEANCSLRLDRLLAGALRVSRRDLASWAKRAWLTAQGGSSRPLRAPVRDGLRVRLAPPLARSLAAR
jgi:hypothetical protein